jgi:predicted transport protein
MTPEEKMVQSIEEKTGKPISHWIEVVKKSGIDKHKAIINHLKEEHGFTYGFANLVAHKAKKSDAKSVGETTDLVELQYKGKDSLKPIYEKLMKEISKFGGVEVAPKKSYVSLRGKKQFALIQPSTKTRVDVGINSKELEFTDRLEKSGSFNSMCSHRVRLTKESEVNKELINWIKQAYEEAK